MKRCDCYNARVETIENKYGSFINAYGVCLGTKEQNRCNCCGDEFKCDFYPEKRKVAEKKMNTAEMWLKAQEDGKTYQCNDVFYNKKHGFVDSDFQPWPINCVDFIDNIFGWDNWYEYEIPLMTKAEAEKKFGIRIVG